MIDYELVKWDKFVPKKLNTTRQKGKYPIFTCDNFISLDTETSHNEDRSESWLYQWAFSYEGEDKRNLVYGRTPKQLAKTLKLIADVNELDETHRLVCYVHNLSYDYSYIKDFIEEEWGHKGTLIAVGNHKLISYEIDGLVFKCSYRLSQKSLDNWCKELGTKHKKLKGAIDYDVVRFQDSKLYKNDWKYMFYDIVCLDEAITKQLEKWNDTLITVPLTNTGYVRREARNKFSENKSNAKDFKNKSLNFVTYNLCKKEFAGGLTHGNRFLANKTVKGTIRHRDFASHYPSQQMCYNAPTSQFVAYYDRNLGSTEKITIKDLLNLTHNHCILASIVISNLEVRKGVTLPIAQVSKFTEGKLDKVKFIEDNGRILKMEEGQSLIVVNEYDLKWLVKQYKFDYDIINIYIANKGPFPKYLRDTVKEFFYKKSYYKAEEKRLKKEGYSEDSKEYIENHLNMMIAKGMLNSIYGMSATDPVRICYYETEEGEWEHTRLTDEEIVVLLDKFYNKRTSFMNYELGCWTTALARNELLDFCEIIGYDNFIYADTDSIFYISTPEIEEKIEKRNEELRKIDEENGWFIEVDGKKSYFNQFELEDEDITEFRFLHAKCYAYVVKDKDGKEELMATIAGVKKHGRNNNTRVKELGNINNLTSGKKFYDCGGTATAYLNRRPQIITIDNHELEVASAAIIMPCEKTLHNEIEVGEIDMFWEVADIE